MKRIPVVMLAAAGALRDEDYLINTVTLGGRVTTRGMVDRVERDAKSVDGVRDVENFVRPMVGGS